MIDLNYNHSGIIDFQFNMSGMSLHDLLNVAIVNPDDKEELALTLDGKKKKLALEHFQYLGTKLELNDNLYP